MLSQHRSKKEESMFSKYMGISSCCIPTSMRLLLVIVGALVLLTACGGASTATSGASTASTSNNAAAAQPTPTVAQPTPTPTIAQPTPTPMVAQSVPVAGSPQTISIVNGSDGSFGFSPATLTIKTGTTVIWKNVSSTAHTVTTDDGSTADSGTIPAGGTFQFTFKTPGSFSYHCNYHPYMRATVGRTFQPPFTKTAPFL
jgi:plastocyanin